MSIWHCVKKCGACCHLAPEDRPNLADYLNPEELELYLSLVGEDGWCINFAQDSRECKIYEQRPSFCRVTPANFQKMYKVSATEFDELAIDCCQQQITGVYGEDSAEMERYNQSYINLPSNEADVP